LHPHFSFSSPAVAFAARAFPCRIRLAGPAAELGLQGPRVCTYFASTTTTQHHHLAAPPAAVDNADGNALQKPAALVSVEAAVQFFLSF